jgi:glucose-1-phosphate thymidylyltransferase
MSIKKQKNKKIKSLTFLLFYVRIIIIIAITNILRGIKMKGIILAGGSGTRLYPLTTITSKQLLPVYDKPMIYYPLSILMLAGISEILIISTPRDLPNFERLLKNGSHLGITLSYAEQANPNGLAEAFIIGADFIGKDSVAMILGDNIFYGNGLKNLLVNAVRNAEKNKIASVFGYYVSDPERFGIVEFNENKKAVSIEEKPKKPKSNYAVTGLYFYDNRVVEFVKGQKPSARNELEITDLNVKYLEANSLDVNVMGRGYAWFDMGTTDSLLDAADFVRVIEKRQGIKIAVLEEISLLNKWISKEQLKSSSEIYGKSDYGLYLKRVENEEIIY